MFKNESHLSNGWYNSQPDAINDLAFGVFNLPADTANLDTLTQMSNHCLWGNWWLTNPSLLARKPRRANWALGYPPGTCMWGSAKQFRRLRWHRTRRKKRRDRYSCRWYRLCPWCSRCWSDSHFDSGRDASSRPLSRFGRRDSWCLFGNLPGRHHWTLKRFRCISYCLLVYF